MYKRQDLPFLSACSKQYHLPYPLDRKDSLDFYASVAPFRSLFASQKLTQRALEQRLQLTRKDPYSGAELIDRYRSWLTTKDEDLLQNLLGQMCIRDSNHAVQCRKRLFTHMIV